jgi:hypothetical protein
MSATCQNCKAKLSCGCQKRVASNGTSVCTQCLIAYEANLKRPKQVSSGTAPTNISVNYHGHVKK